MPNSGYQRSRAREEYLVNVLRAGGWEATRTPASKGGYDVLAARHGEVELWEVKLSPTPFANFPPADRERLIQAAARAGGTATLAWWKTKNGRICAEMEAIPAERWPD